MSTKLTLTIEKDVIEQAKEFAKNENRSLSAIIESYLRSLVSPSSQSNNAIDPSIQSLRGAFKAPDNFDYKNELIKRRDEKYL